MEKKEYVAPKVSFYGDVKEITKATTTGSRIDADFPAGTLFGDLTVS